MSKLNFDREYLEMELSETKARLAGKPDGWIGYEKVGRVLHWMNDPAAPDHFRKAAEIRIKILKPERTQGRELIAIGNYYRFANEAELATNYFLRAHGKLKEQVGKLNEPETLNFHLMQYLLMVSYLLGKYEEVVEYGRAFREESPGFDPKNMGYAFAQLAEARVTNDSAIVKDMVNDLEFNINKNVKHGDAKIHSTGSITGMDLYEIAYDTLTEIEDKQGLNQDSC